MKTKTIIFLVASIVFVASLVLAATYNAGFSYSIIPASVWNASIAPTKYVSYSLVPMGNWFVTQNPYMAASYAIQPMASWYAGYILYLPSWDGKVYFFDTLQGRITTDTIEHWDGGVRLYNPDSNVAVVCVNSTDVKATSHYYRSDGKTCVEIGPHNSTLVYQEAEVVFYVIKPQGVFALGVAPTFNGTVAEPSKVYMLPLHTNITVGLSNTNRIGRIWVAIDGGNKTLAGRTIYLANGTHFEIYITKKGRLAINVSKVEVERASGTLVVIRVVGKLYDSEYMVPAPDVEVTVTDENGVLIGRGYSGSDGSFVIVGTYDTGGRSGVNLRIRAEDADYETLTVVRSVAVPSYFPLSSGGSLDYLLIIGAIAMVMAVALIIAIRKAHTIYIVEAESRWIENAE